MAKQENDNDQDYKARATALRLLARREHSRLELSLKLRQRKLPGDIINAVLDDYEKEGWLDDDRFADVYARQRMDLGYGPLRILGELQQRGVHKTPECVAEMAEENERLKKNCRFFRNFFVELFVLKHLQYQD